MGISAGVTSYSTFLFDSLSMNFKTCLRFCSWNEENDEYGPTPFLNGKSTNVESKSLTNKWKWLVNVGSVNTNFESK